MPHGRRGAPFRSPGQVSQIDKIRRHCHEKGADFDYIWNLAKLALAPPARLSRDTRARFKRLNADLPVLIQWLGSFTEGRALAFALERCDLPWNTISRFPSHPRGGNASAAPPEHRR